MLQLGDLTSYLPGVMSHRLMNTRNIWKCRNRVKFLGYYWTFKKLIGCKLRCHYCYMGLCLLLATGREQQSPGDKVVKTFEELDKIA